MLKLGSIDVSDQVPTSRRSENGSYGSDVAAAHDEAVAAGRAVYEDPVTGYSVFTADALAARGYCCGCGCRHCPYPVAEQRRAGRPGVT